MKSLQNEPRRRRGESGILFGGALLLTLVWVLFMHLTNHDPLAHSSYDTYTLMAMAWRKGLLHLEHDYPWLELAIFGGEYYVSFPPVPTVVMWLLSFVFGENTPSNLVVFGYLLTGYFVAYGLARRFSNALTACMCALTMTLGCNLFACTMDGGVWYQAQLLAYLMLLICAYGMTDKRPAMWAVGLFALALSVGCRPFDALFVPFALWMLWDNLRAKEQLTAEQTILKGIPYCLAPACVAIALAWYNWVRFGNPVEFGHNYLPEFTRDPMKPQMALKYVKGNIENILRLPYFENGKLSFPMFDGFAFWIANPMFVTAALMGVIKLIRRKWDGKDTLLIGLLLAEAFLLLTHKTFGGWQFGTRYLCDLLPMALLFMLRGRRKQGYIFEWVIAFFAIAINLYGARWIYWA